MNILWDFNWISTLFTVINLAYVARRFNFCELLSCCLNMWKIQFNHFSIPTRVRLFTILCEIDLEFTGTKFQWCYKTLSDLMFQQSVAIQITAALIWMFAIF